MAGRLLLTSQAEIQIPGAAPLQLGPRGLIYSVAISGLYDQYRGSVANNTTVTVWDATTSSIASFEFFHIVADQSVLVEFQGTTAADNNDIKIRAGWPVYRTLDDILGYSAGGSFGGSAQVVKKIMVRNTSGSAATVQATVVL